MKSKRGANISTYVIIGLIFVLGSLITNNLIRKSKLTSVELQASEAQNLKAESEVLKTVVDDCIALNYKEARDRPYDLGGGLYRSGHISYMRSGIKSCIESTMRPYMDERRIEFINPDPEIKFNTDGTNIDQLNKLKVTVNYPEPLKLEWEGKTAELREFTYEIPIKEDVNVHIINDPRNTGSTIVEEGIKLPVGEGGTLIIPEGTTVTDENDKPITPGDLDFSIRLVDDDPDALGGGITYEFDYPSGELKFHPKIHFIRQFENDLDFSRRHQYSCFLRNPEVSNILPPQVKNLLKDYGVDYELRPMPTYADREFNQVVCYIDKVSKGQEFMFYDQSCIEILNAHLPSCPLNSKIEFKCMCGNDVLDVNNDGIQCLNNPPRDNPECDRDSQEPEVLPCLCDRFLIYCQDIERLPKIPPPTMKEILEELDILPPSIDSLNLIITQVSQVPEILSKLIERKYEEVLPTILEGIATNDPQRLLKLENILLEDNNKYDPLVCSPRNY